MKLNRVYAAMLFGSLLLLAAAVPLPTTATTNGPREDDLTIRFYSNITEAYLALKTGDVDLLFSPLTKELAVDAALDPNLVLAPVAGYNMYEFDLNNNYSIPDYPGIRSPMNYTEMRQAIAWLTDKDYIVDVLCGGFAERIDQPVAAPLKGWANMSMWYPNYPYEYDPLAAKAVLDSKFPEGTTPNPYYDPSFPGSAQYIRTYPADHSMAGQDLDPLKICVRLDITLRLQYGRMVYGNMRKLGIPCDPQEASSSVLYPIVMNDFNYHLYTGGWSVGRFPPITLYWLFHSINAFPGGNYVTGGHFPFVGDNATDPRLYRGHPQLDNLLYNCNYALSYAEAVTYCKLALGWMTENCVNVPLYSVRSYYCYSSKLLGVVNMEGYGPVNDYTFMNAYKTDGSPIRCGTISPPSAMNIIFSNWEQDWQCLDRMTQASDVKTAPYNLALDMAGFTRDWETTTWDDNGTTKTKLTMTFRSDDYFAKPVSGDQGANVNATHYFMSAFYYLQTSLTFISGFEDLHHIVITGPYSFDVYFNTLSYWNTYYCQGPILPIDMWAQHDELITVKNETFVNQTTPGYIDLDLPIWVESVTFNGSPLTMFTDYNIVNRGGYGSLYVYSSLGTGTLEVRYWAIPSLFSARGYTPGGLPWQTVFEGAGMYYATAFTPGVDGSLTLKRNPYYWMETPPLGEVDFARKPDGAFKVDIFDLVLAAGAFGSQGTGVPSANWFPGADLAPNSGVVDIYDISTVTGVNWQTEYDLP